MGRGKPQCDANPLPGGRSEAAGNFRAHVSPGGQQSPNTGDGDAPASAVRSRLYPSGPFHPLGLRRDRREGFAGEAADTRRPRAAKHADRR